MPTSPANRNRSTPLVPGVLSTLPDPDGSIDAGDRAALAFTAREPFDGVSVGAAPVTIRGRLGGGTIWRGRLAGSLRGRL